jgi:hypothetical protein
MPIKEVIMFGADCDNCGESWIDDHHGFCAFTDESSMQSNLSDDETWYSLDDKCLCPKCFTIDDEDNLIIDPTRTKTIL